MTFIRLPGDCIYDILKYLKNERTTLYNCLLVDRSWCKETVPFLYENPFDNFGKNENDYLIIWTLSFCLDETEILQLKNHLSIEPFNIPNIPINPEYKPLFKYPKYIVNIDSIRIIALIVNWIRNITNKYHYENLDVIYTIFFHSMIRQCNSVRHLNISPSYFLKDSEEIINVFTSNLSKLNFLKLNFSEKVDQDYIFEFLQGISENCLNISKLEIRLSEYTSTSSSQLSEYLCSIIQKQKRLKSIKILNNADFLNDFFLPLEFQKNSLDSIEFENMNLCDISFKNLINLYNLKYLKFHENDGLSSEQCEILEFASFKLKELELYHNNWSYDISLLLIKYFGASLQGLSLDERLIISIRIIENVLDYCSNLITLEISIGSNNEFLIVFPHFKNLKITRLNIKFITESDDNVTYIKLANNLPINVKEISISFNQHVNISQFEKFLENCHNYLEVINLNSFVNLEFLKAILNYVERDNNKLKFLGIMVLEDNDVNDLLDKIKVKGVKLVEPQWCL